MNSPVVDLVPDVSSVMFGPSDDVGRSVAAASSEEEGVLDTDAPSLDAPDVSVD